MRPAWLCHFGQLNTQNPYSNFMLLQTPDFGWDWYNTVLVKTFFSFLNPIWFSFSWLRGPDHSHKGISITSSLFFVSNTDWCVAEVSLIPWNVVPALTVSCLTYVMAQLAQCVTEMIKTFLQWIRHYKTRGDNTCTVGLSLDNGIMEPHTLFFFYCSTVFLLAKGNV